MRKSGFQPFATDTAEEREDAPGGWEAPECQLVLRWIEAFNAVNLEEMLRCMSPAVTFQPLRLHGIDRTYNGHDGITRWLQRVMRLEPDYRIQVEDLSIPLEVTVLAIGRLSLDGLNGGAPFWGVHTVEDGVIVSARHYLGDAALAQRFAMR
jgi:hypothetical protein